MVNNFIWLLEGVIWSEIKFLIDCVSFTVHYNKTAADLYSYEFWLDVFKEYDKKMLVR